MSITSLPEPIVETAPSLRVSAVGVSFRGLRALDDVTFDLPAGGISAVIGPNGAGKTTLFNCISGIYRHEGSVEIQGRSLNRLSADKRAAAGISRTFQTPILLDQLTVLDNVMLGTHTWTRAGMLSNITGFLARREEQTAKDAAWEMLGRVELRQLAGRAVGSLAHADRRRVEIARALIARPHLLMLDEPAAGLSAEEADGLLELTAEIGSQTGMTTVLVEHDVALVMRVARHVVVLDAGKLLAQGTPAKIASDPAVIAAYLGDHSTKDSE